MAPNRTWALVAAAVLCVSIGAAALGQAPANAESKTLIDLTAEVRLLRQAVEEGTRSQTQTQALGIYLSAQQARIVQVAARLDAATRELEATTARSRELAQTLATAEESRARARTSELRAQLEMESRAIRIAQQHVAAEEQQARARESELAQSLHVESARWTDLISRLEQLIKR